MPESIPLPDAAAMLFPYHLAWLGLFDRAELKAGETVLIHAAAGGSGSAAIQLAVNAGARVFATAGSDDKLDVVPRAGRGSGHQLTTEDFVARSSGEDRQGGELRSCLTTSARRSWTSQSAAIAYNGRFLMMGFASNKKVADEKFIVPRQVCLGNFKMCGVLLAYVDDAMGAMLKRGMGWNLLPHSLGARINQQVVDLILKGEVRTVVGRTVNFNEVPSACEALAAGTTTGRTVILL